MRKIRKKENPEERFIATCTQCGKLIKENSGYYIDNKYVCENCFSRIEHKVNNDYTLDAQTQPIYNYSSHTEQKVNNDFKPPQGIIKILVYILSVLNPVIGFLFGSIFFSQSSTENKNFGKNCFILMGIGIFVVLIIFIIVLFLNFTFSGKLSDFQFYEGYY